MGVALPFEYGAMRLEVIRITPTLDHKRDENAASASSPEAVGWMACGEIHVQAILAR